LLHAGRERFRLGKGEDGEYKRDVKRKLQNAYAMTEYADAKRALESLHHMLMYLNPSAARSLEKGKRSPCSA
jgi:hypothetical protein